MLGGGLYTILSVETAVDADPYQAQVTALRRDIEIGWGTAPESETRENRP
jgi:hypothetical protein